MLLCSVYEVEEDQGTISNLNFEVRPMVLVNFVSLQPNPYKLLVTEFVAVQPKA